MLNLNLFRNIGFPLYLFVYLILPYSAITQTLKVDFIRNLETSLNKRDLEFIRKNFRNDENQNIPKQFSKIINDFPDSKWKIKRLESNFTNKEILRIKVIGRKIVNGEMHILESDFDYVFSVLNGKIDQGTIKNLFTTIRNDYKKIDISFKFPEKVLTGSKYDIDIILNKPLEKVIIAGAIKPHQVNSLFEQEILLEPLASGGIFKMTRAPSKPGILIWSGSPVFGVSFMVHCVIRATKLRPSITFCCMGRVNLETHLRTMKLLNSNYNSTLLLIVLCLAIASCSKPERKVDFQGQRGARGLYPDNS